MLPINTLLVFIFIANAVQALEVEKRQTTTVEAAFRFIVLENRQVLFQFNNQDLVRLTGDGTGSRTFNASATISCDTINSPGLELVSDGSVLVNDIDSCSSIDGLILSTTTDGAVEFTGPGTLYYDSDSALFIDMASNGVTQSIETARPSFPQTVEVTFRFNVLENRQVQFQFNNQDLVRLTGDGTASRTLDANAIISCDTNNSPGLVLVSDGSVLVNDIDSCSSIDGLILSTTTDGAVEFTGPGTLYYDSDSALFIDMVSNGVTQSIETARPSFPLLPTETLFPIRNTDNDLVLNIDVTNAPDNFADPGDDIIILTGSMSYNLDATDSITYTGMTIVIRRRSQTLLNMENVEALETAIETSRGLQVSRFSGRDGFPGFLNGPSTLYVGESQLGGGTTAFFTNSESVIRTIQGNITANLLRCNTDGQGVPSLVGNFPPDTNNTFISLTDIVTESFPSPVSIEKDGTGPVLLTSRFNQVAPYFCPEGIELTILAPNYMIVRADRTEMIPQTDFPNGGLTAVFNRDTCTMFAYQTSLSQVTDLITACGESFTIVPQPSIVLESMSGSFGSVDIFSGGDFLLSASSSERYPIGANQVVQYTSMDGQIINIRNSNDLSGDSIAMFVDISSFIVNTDFNRLEMVSSSSSSIVRGPGDLFIDGNRRAFFTNIPAFATFIMNAGTSRSQRVDFTLSPDGNSVLLQSADDSFFEIGDADGFQVRNVTDTQCLLYRNMIIYSSECLYVPEGGSITFISPMDTILVNDSNGRLLYNITGPVPENIFSLNGLNPISTTATEPGRGIYLFGSPSTSSYLPGNVISAEAFTLLSTFGGLTPIEMNIPSFTAFRNRVGVQQFSGDASPVFVGPGTLYQSGDNFLYANNPSGLTLDTITTEFSRLMPISTVYSISTGTVTILGATRNRTNVSFPIESRVVTIPGGTTINISGGNITLPGQDNNLIATNINTLRFFNGLTIRDINAVTEVDELPGGGLLLIDEDTGMAFYTTNTIAIQRITSRITGVIRSFVSPSIPTPFPSTFTSKLNTVEAEFGQIVTVFSGADVELRCRAGSANPPADFTFSRRLVSSSSPDFMEIENPNVVFSGVNEATLILPNVNISEIEYQCQASNVRGSASSTTRLRVRQGEDAEIVNNFFAGRQSSSELVVTARSDGLRTFIPILAPIDATGTVIDDRSQLVDGVAIGCRASGRPKADISWFRAVAGGPRQEINTSLPNFNVTSSRAGESRLTVGLDSGDVDCYVYICVAENGGGPVEGSVQICPQRFTAEAVANQTPCPVTCGVGVRSTTPPFQRNFNGTAETVMLEALPIGLIKPTFTFCQSDSSMACPVIEFQWVSGPYGECTEFCDSGEQTREVNCVRFVGVVANKTVDDELCRNETRPPVTRDCNDIPCPAYITVPFGECNRTCGPGFRSRNITCVNATLVDGFVVDGIAVNGTFSFKEDDREEIDIEFCYNYSRQVRPVEMEACQIQECMVRYYTSPYSPCDEFNCRVRNVSCVFFDPHDPNEKWEADEELCRERGLIPPHTVSSCGGGECSFGRWRAESALGPAGSCSELCGIGSQDQTVSCVNPTDSQLIETGFCPASSRPPYQLECFIRNCPGSCVREPPICPLIKRLKLCKLESIMPRTQDCCISCPFQATPIPPLATMPAPVEPTTMEPTTMETTTM